MRHQLRRVAILTQAICNAVSSAHRGAIQPDNFPRARHISLQFVVVWLGLALFGCATPQSQNKYNATSQRINDELIKAAQPPKQEQPDSVKNALLPPLKIEMPKASGKALEPRFDLVVHGAPAAQVFMGIVSGTRYSMLIPPDLSGTISVNLKDVTVFEALEAIREINGYEYKVEGTRIYIQPLTMQTRVFKVNYLVGSRKGSTSIQVKGGTTGTSTSSSAGGSTNIDTSSSSDFWKELTASLNAILGQGKGGGSVVVSPQSGVIVARATPLELRNIAEFLNASQLSVERQVILEAKILEVALNDTYQAGINWGAFKINSSSRLSAGAPGGNEMGPYGALQSDTGVSGVPGSSLKGTGGLFGLVFQTGSFAATLSFLESQGNVNVLSSPRIATVNNQKAVLKVGSEDYYVTSVSSPIVTTDKNGNQQITPSAPVLQQYFSGIVLDVTPQIDQNDNVILHIHPSVTRVSESNKVINMGSSGTLTLPFASANVSETDSIVRAHDGQIVAIGGLMKQSTTGDIQQTPGIKDVPVLGDALRQTNRSTQKSELVILLKPTIVHDDNDWAQDILNIQQRVQAMGRD
ncbi:MAG: secretin N-terminal domain-containing protein [Sulfuricellaceae bacterium]